MSENPFRPPSSFPSQEIDISRPVSHWYSLRLIPAFLSLITSLWMFALCLILMSISVSRGNLPPIEAIGLDGTAGFSCRVFAYAARCLYLSVWKLALMASLGALISMGILIGCASILYKNNERARSERMPSSHFTVTKSLTTAGTSIRRAQGII